MHAPELRVWTNPASVWIAVDDCRYSEGGSQLGTYPMNLTSRHIIWYNLKMVYIDYLGSWLVNRKFVTDYKKKIARGKRQSFLKENTY